MTREEILRKSIEKAMKNGWKWDDHIDCACSCCIVFQKGFAEAFWKDDRGVIEKNGICLHCKGETKIANPTGFCDHVYFPEHSCNVCGKKNDWQYYFQQMVISEYPLKYLEQFLEKENDEKD